jgi:hypothetical protein
MYGPRTSSLSCRVPCGQFNWSWLPTGVIVMTSRRTVTVKPQFVVLPQESLATQFTGVVPSGKLLPLGGLHTRFKGGHPPLAVEVKNTVVPAALAVVTVMLLEQVSVIGGQTNGLTVTLNEQLVEWPHASVATQFTGVVPSEKLLPLGGLQLRFSGAQPPKAELLKKTVAPVLVQLAVVTVMLLEQVSVIAGQTNGLTVTLKEQLVEPPQASLAVQVTNVVPSGKLPPLGGLQLRVSGAQPPEAELLKKTVALVLVQLAVVTVILLEQVSVMGGRTTVTWKEQLVLFPQLSLAVQVTRVIPIGKVLPLGGLQISTGGGLHPPLADEE